MILDSSRPLRRNGVAQAGYYLWGAFSSGAVLAIILAIWQIAANHLGPLVLPEPLAVFKTVGIILQNLSAHDIPITIYRASVGIATALVIGISLGLLAGSFKSLGLFFRPCISVLLGMPPIIWVVLALFWFGMGSQSAIFTIIITVIPLTFAAAMRGMLSVDEGLKEMLDVYRVSFSKQLKNLYFPHLLNHLLPAVSVALGTGIKIAIMAELLGANNGLGAQLAMARAMLDTETVLAYVVVILGMIFIVEYLIIEPLRIIFMPWEQ
ncbi:MAG: ABC transporter permease subunit [Alcaligenaceae bacterium]|nr:ABC transporter permease subunit [Alcaligenaceae bacterium]